MTEPTILVYIAGPFSEGGKAATHWDVARNVHAAKVAASEVLSLGGAVMPVIPHTMTHDFHGERDHAFWIAGTLELMRCCDVVYVCPREKDSPGTLGEIAEAQRFDIPVCRTKDELITAVAAIRAMSNGDRVGQLLKQILKDGDEK